MVTPLQWREWDLTLSRHPDRRFRDYIVHGLRFGFRVGFHKDTAGGTGRPPRNMPSARDRPEVIDEYLAVECSKGRVIGPLDQALFPDIHVNRFGVIPKGTSGKWRLIVDMSFPEGASVNDGVSEALSTLTYIGIGDAVKGITTRGKGTRMAKVDVKSAYRNIPVHPEDRWLMGMRWRETLFVDTALPFGLRSAPKIFTAIADAVEWIAREEGVQFVIHYLDDFLVLGAPDTNECETAVQKLLDVFSRLGLPVATDKLEGPTTRLVFLGFELDTVAWEIRLPRQKLEDLKELIRQWVGRRTCSRKELESLVGKLGHAAQVVPPGKTFMRRLFELKAAMGQARGKIRLNNGFRSDIMWWATFLEPWNGVRMMKDNSQQQAASIWTDASGSFGCGAWNPATSEWFQMQWSTGQGQVQSGIEEEGITLKELLPVVLACAIWGRYWAGQVVRFYCDNTGAVAVVNSGYSRIPQIMHLLRCLFFIRARFHVEVWATHTPGVQNGMADAISRNNLHYFFYQAPDAQRRRIAIPVALLVEQRPDWTSQTWTQLFETSFQLA